jgi:amphi-Trp domain-containing protein
MAKNTHTFEHESLQDKESVMNYLKVISEGFDSGLIHLANEEDEVTLSPKGLSRLKIKAKQAKNHQEIRITLAWTADTQTDIDEDDSLQIASKKPKKKAKKKK